MLEEIRQADARLTERFASKLEVNPDLDRTLVSFQANKSESGYRWAKYKEGFSATLVRYALRNVGVSSGRILDPFAGSGTSLFVASELGIDAVGIELLPNCAEIIEVRRMLLDANRKRMPEEIRNFRASRAWEGRGKEKRFPHLRITSGAFPEMSERALGRYLYEVEQIDDQQLARVLRFAALCVLESISYTRKDGQYLRWDWRSGRRAGRNRFEKGKILGFTEAISTKLEEIAGDVGGDEMLFDLSPASNGGKIELLVGSCLDILPTLKARSLNGIITSPPYCNRYDYTRTYALELAMLDLDEDGIRNLRQTMLSCTVENREKEGLEKMFQSNRFWKATEAWSSQEVLKLILAYLEACRADGSINNTGIPRMVCNYFKEMALVIFECARVLKVGAPFVMVNDNVRYQGAHVPVDLILSDFAQKAGFEVESIWVLPRGKGNSSQQMGKHGREEIRKCVYVWRKLRARQTKPLGRQLAQAR